MAVCFFNKDFGNRMQCEYEEKDNEIRVIVDYEIDDEIESNNGIRSFGINTKFENRDILIVDYDKKKNFLLKDASYNGHQSVWGTPDDGVKSKFISRVYFIKKNYDDLVSLKNTPKVQTIRIYSDIIIDFIGYQSLEAFDNENEWSIKLKKQTDSKEKDKTFSFDLNKNNIKNVSISDTWNSKHNRDNKQIQIDFTGYIEIDLVKRINYDNCYDYIREIQTFMQLLLPNKFEINKITVLIDNKWYDLNFPISKIDINPKRVETSVNENISLFLKKCYENIPYRGKKNEVRNIPYITLNTPRNLEDNFLMFYRFIECYYKRKSIKNITTTFISYSILNNYKPTFEISESNLENLTQEIISLRNHYVHSGYFIKNFSLKINYKKIDNKKNPKDYTATNVDFDWIYDRTKILYDIVINIIFKDMLKYEQYNFTKHF